MQATQGSMRTADVSGIFGILAPTRGPKIPQTVLQMNVGNTNQQCFIFSLKAELIFGGNSGTGGCVNFPLAA